MNRPVHILSRTALAVGAAALVSAAAALPADAAPRDLMTVCKGEGGAVTVATDLKVPAGEVCNLSGTIVQGDVKVGPDADLLIEDGVIEGNIVVKENGYFDAIDTETGGNIKLAGAYGAYLDGTAVGGKLVTRGTDEIDQAGFVYSIGGSVGDKLASEGGEVLLEDADVMGDLVSKGDFYADVYGGFVDGDVRVDGSSEGSIMCGIAVQGDSKFTGNGGPVQLGSNGPISDCEQGSYWGGDVTLDGTSGDSFVDQNIVGGDLTLGSNDPLPNVGPNNRVRGEIDGEFTEWDGTSMPAANKRMAAAAEDRGADLQAEVKDRRGAATAEADKAGKANL